MNLKKLLSILLALLMNISSLTAYAGEKKVQKELPFYFPPGVVQALSPVQQMQEYLRLLAATNDQFQAKPLSGPLIQGDSIVIETKLESTSTDSPPVKMKLVLDHYVRLPDGRIRVTFLNGQTIITDHQLEVVQDDLIEQVKLAASYNCEVGKNITDLAIRSRSEKLGIPENEFRAKLDEKIAGRNITIRELNGLPKDTHCSDFIPRELHLGYNTELPGIFGVAWLNTGIVYYNPQARIRDYLSGRPLVLQHEMTHNNSNLQALPMSEGADMELLASIPEMLYPENQIDFFYHGYAKDLRELMWIYFGFNPKQVKKEIVRFNQAGNLVIDEEKYNETFQKLEKIKEEFRSVLPKMISEFYSTQVWWLAMNEELVDKNAVFRIMMPIYYEPTILGGSEETRKWREAHQPEIEAMAEKAYEVSGKKPNGDQPTVVESQSSQLVFSEYQNFFTEEERERIKDYFEKNPEALEKLSKMNALELVQFFKNFKSTIGGMR